MNRIRTIHVYWFYPRAVQTVQWNLITKFLLRTPTSEIKWVVRGWSSAKFYHHITYRWKSKACEMHKFNTVSFATVWAPVQVTVYLKPLSYTIVVRWAKILIYDQKKQNLWEIESYCHELLVSVKFWKSLRPYANGRGLCFQTVCAKKPNNLLVQESELCLCKTIGEIA